MFSAVSRFSEQFYNLTANGSFKRSKAAVLMSTSISSHLQDSWDFVLPFADKGGYASRLSDLLNYPEKHFLALTGVNVEVIAEPESKWDVSV
jgi:hypothetical protein